MQQSLAIAGTEWAATDMAFDQLAKANAIRNRTQIWAGTSCVWSGGAVTNPSGLTIAVSGPLQFQALGEMGVIATPANLTVANGTNYVIAQYLETTDTPAPFYAGGSPPNIHQNSAPAVITRQSGAAVEANHEVNLATVTVSGGAVTNISDTRVIGPSVTAGNILLGAGNSIDGMDPSAHAALVASSTVLGHVRLGPSGAAAYSTLMGAYTQDFFLDKASTLGSSYVLDEGDFSVPPAGASAVFTVSHPTRYGDLWYAGYGPRICSRFTLEFLSPTTYVQPLYLGAWDDTLRVRVNGSQVFSAAAPGQDQSLSFTVNVGANTLRFYQGNVGGNQFYLQAYCPVLNENGNTFNG